MTVNELSRFQLDELKQEYLITHLLGNENRTPSWLEFCEAHSIVSDDAVKDAYAGVEFSDDDFCCTCSASRRAVEGTVEKERWEYYRVSDGWFTYYVNRTTGEKKYSLDPGDVEIPAELDSFVREK